MDPHLIILNNYLDEIEKLKADLQIHVENKNYEEADWVQNALYVKTREFENFKFFLSEQKKDQFVINTFKKSQVLETHLKKFLKGEISDLEIVLKSIKRSSFTIKISKVTDAKNIRLILKEQPIISDHLNQLKASALGWRSVEPNQYEYHPPMKNRKTKWLLEFIARTVFEVLPVRYSNFSAEIRATQ